MHKVTSYDGLLIQAMTQAMTGHKLEFQVGCDGRHISLRVGDVHLTASTGFALWFHAADGIHIIASRWTATVQ